jgi:hypothetical protein
VGVILVTNENDAEPLFTSVISLSGAPVAKALELTATLLPNSMPPIALRVKLDSRIVSLKSQLFPLS